MRLRILCIGKTTPDYLATGVDLFITRLKHYCQIEFEILKDVKHAKNLSPEVLKLKEAQIFEHRISDKDFLILLDEKGKTFTSRAFSEHLEKTQITHPSKKTTFLIGGAFGVSQSIKSRADMTISLSKMTFSHQWVRLILSEQIYRAFTIIKGEKYHND